MAFKGDKYAFSVWFGEIPTEKETKTWEKKGIKHYGDNRTGELSGFDEVIKQIRNKNVKRILLTINNGEIQKIETELSGVLSVAEGKKIIETLALKNYNSIELYSMDGRILSFTRDR